MSTARPILLKCLIARGIEELEILGETAKQGGLNKRVGGGVEKCFEI